MFVGFSYTCVSIFVRFLIISMPIKEILIVINRKFHRKSQAGVEAIKSSKKISCSGGTGHPDQGIISISLV